MKPLIFLKRIKCWIFGDHIWIRRGMKRIIQRKSGDSDIIPEPLFRHNWECMDCEYKAFTYETADKFKARIRSRKFFNLPEPANRQPWKEKKTNGY